MRNIKIVADSSANILALKTVSFAVAPLKIHTSEREFVDNEVLDVQDMISYFDAYSGRSKTSCPNPSDWLAAFDEAEDVVCVTITSGLSGSYNAACAAKAMYEAEHPDRRVCVIDSLSAGPEPALIVEKLEEWITEGVPYEELKTKAEAYKASTGLLFVLASLKNFAANGRVSPSVAKIAGFLGIRVVGKASDAGDLEPLAKCRGEERSLGTMLTFLKAEGVCKGRVRIAYCQNEKAAMQLTEKIQSEFPLACVEIEECRGLCSYYAERGGLLVGFEKW